MTRKSVCLLAVASIAVVLVARLSVGMESLHAVEIDMPEAQPIVSVLEETYRLRMMVACDSTVDVRVLETVMVDTPDYQPDENQKRMIASVFGEQTLRRDGYLTLMKAYYLEQRGIFVGPTPAQPPGVSPTPKPVIYCQTPLIEPTLDFRSISMNDDRAEAQFDDGPALEDAVLVRIYGRWLVSGIRPLRIHF